MMESILSIQIQSCERDIKFNKKWFRYQFVWFVFSFFLTLFDCQTFYISPDSISAISIGAMLVNMLWILFFLIETRTDLGLDRQRLVFLQQLQATDTQQDAVNAYEIAREHYESDDFKKDLRK